MIKNILLSFFGLFFALMVAELIARSYYDGLIMNGTIMTNDDELAFVHKKGASVELHTGEFRNHFAIDKDLGVRVERSSDSVPLEPEYLVYGDSMVFGYGVEFADVFTEVLNRRYGAGTFLNAGVYSYGPDQEFRLADRLRETINPEREVVLFFAGNDLENFEYYFKTKVGEEGRVSFSEVSDPAGSFRRVVTNLAIYPILTRFHLFHWVRSVLLQGGSSPRPLHERFPQYDAQDLTPEDKEKINKLVAIYQNWSDRVGYENFYLIIAPHQQSLTMEDSRVAMMLEELKGSVQVFNYLDYLSEEELEEFSDMFYSEDAHWNTRGHATAANVLEKILGLRVKVSSNST